MGMSMKIYLINLDRREDRLRIMENRFDDLGCTFIRIPAFDGLQHAKTLDNWSYVLTPGEVGCFLSHKKCIQLIAHGDDEYGVILEDDVDLSSNIYRYITDVCWIPSDADIIKLETFHTRVKLSTLRPLAFGNVSIGRLMSEHIGSAAYIISKRAACNILPMLDCVLVPIDDFLFTPDKGILSSINVYQTVPALCKQSGDFSTINADRIEWYKHKKENNKRPSLFKLITREALRPIHRAMKATRIKIRALKYGPKDNHEWQIIPFV